MIPGFVSETGGLGERLAPVGFPDAKSGCAPDGFPVHGSAPSSEPRQAAPRAGFLSANNLRLSTSPRMA